MDIFLQNLSVYSVLLPFLTGLLFIKFQDANARIMIFMLAFACISQIIGSKSKEHQFLIYNIYTLIDVSFWTLLFYRNTFYKFGKSIILLLYFGQIIYALISFFLLGVNSRFFSELVCFDLAIQAICVLIFFYEKFSREEIMKLQEEPMFWFSLGILLYAPTTYFLFVSRYFVVKDLFKEIWKYHHIFNTLLYLLITIGFLIRIKRTKHPLLWV